MPNPEPPRSPQWSTARRHWLAIHNTCAHCGGVNQLEVHHTVPFHIHPDLELDTDNFMTLCEAKQECHLKYGHLGNWKTFNPQLVSPAMLAKLPGIVAQLPDMVPKKAA